MISGMAMWVVPQTLPQQNNCNWWKLLKNCFQKKIVFKSLEIVLRPYDKWRNIHSRKRGILVKRVRVYGIWAMTCSLFCPPAWHDGSPTMGNWSQEHRAASSLVPRPWPYHPRRNRPPTIPTSNSRLPVAEALIQARAAERSGALFFHLVPTHTEVYFVAGWEYWTQLFQLAQMVKVSCQEKQAMKSWG